MKQFVALLFFLFLASFLLWGSGAGQAAQASSVAQAPTPTRPPMQPLPTPISTATPEAELPSEGGFIELGFTSRETYWTIVQWQDGLGNWHNVEGWQGTPTDGKVVWWVAPSDFGKGPFRWVVYAARDSRLLATTDSFYLPRHSGEIVKARPIWYNVRTRGWRGK